MWSLRIQRTNSEHAALHAALATILEPYLNSTDFGRLTGEIHANLTDAAWVEKLPTPALATLAAEVVSIIDQYVGPIEKLRYTWRLLRDNLHACHLYMTPQGGTLIRPLIPPTWTHAPFANARQRIFMSATLGEGGDLERLTGRQNITRVARA